MNEEAYYFQVLIEDVSELKELLTEIEAFSFGIDWDYEDKVCTVIFSTQQELLLVLQTIDFDVASSED